MKMWFAFEPFRDNSSKPGLPLAALPSTICELVPLALRFHRPFRRTRGPGLVGFESASDDLFSQLNISHSQLILSGTVATKACSLCLLVNLVNRVGDSCHHSGSSCCGSGSQKLAINPTM